MSIGRVTERFMAMNEATWRRHTNPWSGWSRLTILPLLTVALWGRASLGWWTLVPVAAVALWTWWNPRAFPEPANTDNWISRGVLGERLWLNRKNVAIPHHHVRFTTILGAITAIGLIPYTWGIVALDLRLNILGLVITVGGKLWFLDRMVWLHQDMQRTDAP